MNKKFFLVSTTLVVGALLVLWLFFRESPKASDNVPFQAETCLVFQSSDVSAPCYVSPAPVTASQETPAIASECDQTSLFEKNDCITKLAEEKKNTSLCDSVEGALARAACVQRGANSEPEMVSRPQLGTYESFIRDYQATVPGTTASSPVESVAVLGSSPVSDDSSETSVEAFYERSANQAPLTLYAVQPYQNKPGSIARLQGWGFALDATNVVYVGGTAVSGLASEDGMTLSFTVPSVSSGTYEVYVSNARGSSRVSERPIYMVVSNSPIAAPRITSVSPANPTYADTITLSGENMGGLKGVYTTLGPSKSASLSFRIADLEHANLVLDDPSVKGMKIPLYVYVLAEGGLNAEPFVFDVQY